MVVWPASPESVTWLLNALRDTVIGLEGRDVPPQARAPQSGPTSPQNNKVSRSRLPAARDTAVVTGLLGIG